MPVAREFLGKCPANALSAAGDDHRRQSEAGIRPEIGIVHLELSPNRVSRPKKLQHLAKKRTSSLIGAGALVIGRRAGDREFSR